MEGKVKRYFVPILFLAVITAGCSLFSKTAPSGSLPVISTFSVTPASGKAPLTVEFKMDVTNAERCDIVGIGNVPCVGTKAWSVSASTDFQLTARNANGDTVPQIARVTVTP